jgi:hypothetical protein
MFGNSFQQILTAIYVIATIALTYKRLTYNSDRAL